MVALQRLALLFKDSLPTDNTSVAFIATHQDLFAFVPGADWEWETIRRLGSYAARRKAAGEHADALDSAIEQWNGSGFAADAAPDLARVFDVPVTKLAGLASELPPLGDPFDALTRIERGIRLASRLGLDPVALRQLTSATFLGLTAARDLVYGAMREKHENRGGLAGGERTVPGKGRRDQAGRARRPHPQPRVPAGISKRPRHLSLLPARRRNGRVRAHLARQSRDLELPALRPTLSDGSGTGSGR